MVDLDSDELRGLLGAAASESVIDAARRVVRERDALRRRVASREWAQAGGLEPDGPLAWAVSEPDPPDSQVTAHGEESGV